MAIIGFVIGVLFGFIAEHAAAVGAVAAAFAFVTVFRIARKGGLATGFHRGVHAYKDAIEEIGNAEFRVRNAESSVAFYNAELERAREKCLEEGWDRGWNNQLKGNFTYEHRNWVQEEYEKSSRRADEAKFALNAAKAELAAARDAAESMLS